MDEDVKTKDNLNFRKDLACICKRKELEITTENNGVIKPKASYAISNKQQSDVRKWLQKLKLPDGYASNISKCVDLDDDKLFGFKSHDCHMLVERLISVAFRHLLPNSVWESVTKFCHFFRDNCSTVVQVQHMKYRWMYPFE
ncbi:hypothetical protein LIER_41047 [Lithospermum erythrorhizon]|uniref:Uncharacterized protein n=1 Tax=Lithospermum erythrorhizon TaxID=34254 RepID=A0AAV3R7D9_LITER